MSTLSGNSIQSTYQGLLKLNDSTSGITNTPQNITDGLGNPTGLKLSTNYLQSQSQTNFQPLGRSNGGDGIRTSGAGGLVIIVDKLFGRFFQVQAGETYTGITFSVGTVTTGDDSVDFAIYTIGRSDTYGIAPKDLIMSGFSLSNSDLLSIGLKTIALPSPLTFTDSGIYCLTALIQSSGTPTFRMRDSNINQPANLSYDLSLMYGYVLDFNGNCFSNPFRGSSTPTNCVEYTTTGPFLSSYDVETLGSTATGVFSPSFGFVLNK